MPVDPLLEQLLQGFVDESQEICERVTRDLLELEKGAKPKAAAGRAFENLLRGLHTLKGSAATLGLDELADVAHLLEDVVAPLRASDRLPTPIADALLRSLDAWMSRLRATALDQPLPDLAPTSELLRATRTLASTPAQAWPDRAPVTTAAPEASKASPPSPVAAAAPASATRAGDIHITEDPGDATWRVSTRQVTALRHDVERLREVRLRLEERQRELEKGLVQLARIGHELRATSGSGGRPQLPPQTAETRSVLGSVNRGLSSDIEEASDIVASLEDGLKAISTQPMRTVLEPLRRAVRDLARQSGKLVGLSVVGGEVSHDRRVLEALRSPLVHLVRNAVDHGIETPEVREGLGKHAEGALVVRVEQQGNMLFIEVADDGNGIDLDKVRGAALQRGLYGAEELATLTAPQLQQLIFSPGFTTRAEVSEVSGRGVGLDIVRNEIQALSGQVEVQSAAGQGTRFILSLPVELGSSPVLVVRCGEHQLGIPTMAVESSRSARGNDVNRGKPQLRYAWREELIPLHDLGALLGLRQAELPRDDQPLFIISAQGRRLALAVDEVLGERELVIRPLPPEVRDLPAYQGAATLARGELVLIVRSDWLASNELQARIAAKVPAPRALVVDDSLTARAMHRTSLESGGLIVHTARSGHKALEQLRHASYDVLVADVRMDDLDGYALTREVRARPETAQLPILLVSTQEGEAERRRSLEAGADAFLSKRDCAAGRLLSEVRALIAARLQRTRSSTRHPG